MIFHVKLYQVHWSFPGNVSSGCTQDILWSCCTLISSAEMVQMQIWHLSHDKPTPIQKTSINEMIGTKNHRTPLPTIFPTPTSHTRALPVDIQWWTAPCADGCTLHRSSAHRRGNDAAVGSRWSKHHRVGKRPVKHAYDLCQRDHLGRYLPSTSYWLRHQTENFPKGMKRHLSFWRCMLEFHIFWGYTWPVHPTNSTNRHPHLLGIGDPP